VRRRNVAALMGAAGVALGVAVAAPAHADDAQFLADMHALRCGNDNGDAGHLYKNLCLGSAVPSRPPGQVESLTTCDQRRLSKICGTKYGTRMTPMRWTGS
jgi:hypothetical protein